MLEREEKDSASWIVRFFASSRHRRPQRPEETRTGRANSPGRDDLAQLVPFEQRFNNKMQSSSLLKQRRDRPLIVGGGDRDHLAFVCEGESAPFDLAAASVPTRPNRRRATTASRWTRRSGIPPRGRLEGVASQLFIRLPQKPIVVQTVLPECLTKNRRRDFCVSPEAPNLLHPTCFALRED